MKQAVYIVDALRTPIGKLQGKLASYRPEDLVRPLINAFSQRHDVMWEDLEEVILGCANQAGEDNRNLARRVALLADFPPHVAGVTVNRLCASGTDAIIQAARMIALQEADFCLAGGVESMSRSPWVTHRYTEERVDSTIGWRFVHPDLSPRYAPLEMSETAEKLAQKLGISRTAQDAYAWQSRARYAEAAAAGLWAPEIVPLPPLSSDEQVRQLAPHVLAKMKGLVSGGQHVSIGNTARVGDGAALLLLASEAYVARHNLKPLARIEAWATAAVHPDDMGLAPIAATQKLLKRSALSLQNCTHIELSESFAVQTLACIEALQLPTARVNPQGGAIAMGNPTAMGSARLVVSLAHRLARTGGTGLASTCAGLGLGQSLFLRAV